MASAARCSSAGEERNEEGRRREGHPDHAQMMNKLVGAVMKKLAYSDPSKTFTLDQKNDIKRQVCRLVPVFKTPDHPTYAAMIREAIEELNEVHGSTEESISKFITEKFDSLPLAHASFLSLHLKKLIKRGEIVRVSKYCYMLPGEKADSLFKGECVPRQKQAQKGRGKRKSAKRDEHKTLAEEQVKETEKKTHQGQQCEEPHYGKAVDDQTGSLEKESIQDKVNGRQCQRKIEAIAAIAEKQSQEKIEEDQQRKVIDDQEGSSDAQHGEVMKEKIQDIVVIVVPLKHDYELPKKQQVEVPEQQQQLGQQSEELIREEQHSMVIDYQNGFPVEETVQQHEASTPKSQNQGLVNQVIVKKAEKQNVEHDSMAIDCQNGSPDEENVPLDEADSMKSQNQVQEPEVIAEEQNIEQTYKEDEVHEVTEQVREDGHEIQESIQAEQRGKMIDNKYCSTDRQEDTVNGHENQKHMQEVALIVDKQNVEVKKDQVTEEQVEVIEQKTEYVKQSEEPMQHMKVIDCENGSSEKQIEQKDEVNGQQSENQMHTAVVVEGSNFLEQTHNVNEEKQDEVTEKHVQLTEQGEFEQLSQVASLEEQNSKVIECQNGSPEQQNKQEDDVNEDQLQEIILSVEKQNVAKLKLKVADERIEASMDKIIEEQCQTEEQSCEVIEQQTQAVKSDIQLNGEVFEAILTGTKAQQSDMISERNRSQDQFESTSMQELLSMNQEKDAATVVKSNVPIAYPKFSHDISSKFSEMTCKLLENNIKLQEKTHKLLEDKIKVEKKTHRLLENNIKVQEKTLQVQEMLFELLKGFKNTNQNLVIGERLTPNIGHCGEREYIDCGLPAKQTHRPEISAQTKALESQLNEMSASVELPTDATHLFLKQGKLWNLSQQQVPKYQNKSVDTLPGAVQPQPQEIGISERLCDLPTMEGGNEELSGPVRKKIRSSIEANQVTEKQLQIHNAEVNPDFLEKQLSESDCEVAEAPKCQDEDHEAGNVIKEKAIQSSPPILELAEGQQSCQRQLEKQEQQPQRQLCLQGRKSVEPDSGVAMAPELQQEEHPKDPIHEKMKLDHKPADQRKFCPGGQLYSISELSLATSSIELLARKNHDTESEIEEKTRELKTSAKETGQTQLQQWRLTPESVNQFKFKHSSLSNTAMPQVENPGVKESPQLKKLSQVGKPGVGDSSQAQLKKRQDNHLHKRKRCTPEPTTIPDAIGATLTCQIGSGPMIEPNPEALQDLRPTMSDHLSQPMEEKQNPHGQRNKSNPTAGGSPDELTLTPQHLVVDPQILVKPPQLNSAAVGQLAQTTKQFLQKQQLLRHMKVHSQSEPDVLIVGDLSQTTKELPQKQQLPCHRKLRSHSQAASQCEPDVQMIELPSSKHPCEKPQEQKHPKQPQKQRGRAPKPTLDRAGPAKIQKLQEQPERRGRHPKSDVNTTSGGKLISKNKQKQPKSPGKTKTRKVTKGKVQIQVRGKPQKGTRGTVKRQVRETAQNVTKGTPKSQGRGRARKVTEGT